MSFTVKNWKYHHKKQHLWFQWWINKWLKREPESQLDTWPKIKSVNCVRWLSRLWDAEKFFSDYFTQKIASMVMVQQYELIWRETKWYKEKWMGAHVLENGREKLVSVTSNSVCKRLQFHRDQNSRLRTKKIWVCNIKCSEQINIKQNVTKSTSNFGS